MTASPTEAEPAREMVEAAEVERLVTAIDRAGRGYSIRLTRLVDDEATYTLVYREHTSEHESHDEASDKLAELTRVDKIAAARAAIAAIRQFDPPFLQAASGDRGK